jgi:hypothetical protein
MSSETGTMRDSVAAKWAAAKPILLGLAVGLVAGPIVSGMTGFQVRSSTAQAASRAGIVEQQAAFCAERARGAATGTNLADWQARNDLARKWAVMPGATVADPEVAYACAGRLAN